MYNSCHYSRYTLSDTLSPVIVLTVFVSSRSLWSRYVLSCRRWSCFQLVELVHFLLHTAHLGLQRHDLGVLGPHVLLHLLLLVQVLLPRVWSTILMDHAFGPCRCFAHVSVRHHTLEDVLLLLLGLLQLELVALSCQLVIVIVF